MVRRVSLYSGPGVGKSTLAAKIFSELKAKGYDIELTSEYIKEWAYQNRKPESYDPLYVFAKQVRSEDIALRHVNTVVTDSPVLMNAAYSTYHGFGSASSLVDLAKNFNKDFPSLDLFVERTVDYNGKGRYENYEQAVKFDNFLKGFLDEQLQKKYISVRVDEFDDIISIIENHI